MQSKERQTYKRWNNRAINETLQLLSQFSLSETAIKLGVSYQSLLKALRRNQISPRKIASLTYKNTRQNRRSRGFIAPNQVALSDFTISKITDKEPDRCSWPMGDIERGDLHFCNAPCVKGNYCQQHYEKAHTI